MESKEKELPNLRQLAEKCVRGHFQALTDNQEIEDMAKAIHEYAVLFAKWHREKQSEVIKNNFEDQFENTLSLGDIRTINGIILNAYKEDRIV